MGAGLPRTSSPGYRGGADGDGGGRPDHGGGPRGASGGLAPSGGGDPGGDGSLRGGRVPACAAECRRTGGGRSVTTTGRTNRVWVAWGSWSSGWQHGLAGAAGIR